MSRPRHLWSGDWESDSAAVTDELGRRRETELPAEPRPETPPSPPRRPALGSILLWLRRQAREARERQRARRQRARARARQPRTRRPRARPAGRRRLHIVLIVASAGLLSAAIAYGVTTLLVGSGNGTVTSASRAEAWLGVDLMSVPVGSGVVVADVEPGGPAENAGLAPGDMITAIDGRPVSSVNDFTAAINGLHVGSQVEIQYTLGMAIPGSYTTHATLAAEPRGYP